jgi:hypothetical protein
MRVVPSIRQAEPAPSLVLSLAASLWVKVEVWRLRRIHAGLLRAERRGDAEALARWVTRGNRVVADLDTVRFAGKPSKRTR